MQIRISFKRVGLGGLGVGRRQFFFGDGQYLSPLTVFLMLRLGDFALCAQVHQQEEETQERDESEHKTQQPMEVKVIFSTYYERDQSSCDCDNDVDHERACMNDHPFLAQSVTKTVEAQLLLYFHKRSDHYNRGRNHNSKIDVQQHKVHRREGTKISPNR